LFVPEESADALVEALCGALDALVLGDPADPGVDIGPVIDSDARAALEAHVLLLQRDARVIYRKNIGALADIGAFFGPVVAEIPAPDFIEREVFGPILHIYRYAADELETAARRFAARGYGLTLGVHSRLEHFAERVRACVPAGNTYINRSIIGAVVGVQPFGGEGLSGTGPKAGGPHSLLRYAVERVVTINSAAQGGDPTLLNLD
jgi:RHH-type proline utilization regulon transcriptional repressor/proline dehydrogenase/delta 1-pyrroline-5-carboxylate dehydrogenase